MTWFLSSYAKYHHMCCDSKSSDTVTRETTTSVVWQL